MARLLFMLSFFCGTALGQPCEKIEVDSCLSLGNNQTSYPNNLGHETQDEAKREFLPFTPLLKIDCSPSSLSFFCTLFFSPCTIFEHPIPPCRNSCEAVQSGCGSLLERFGFEWPENFSCERFPEETEGVCIPAQTPSTVTITQEMTTSPGTTVSDKLLAFRARYKANCTQYDKSKKRRNLIYQSAVANREQFDDICAGVCSVYWQPQVTCEGKRMEVFWLTNLTAQASSRKQKKELNKRIKIKRRMALSIISGSKELFSFPKVSKNGQMVRIVQV
ncbi:frizzled-1-like [Watersipora subatra]|uniref:frizzled-1-like n=1 Tax=Watersipora subatra TaxID=2589382 RepID=UPI00355B7A29